MLGSFVDVEFIPRKIDTHLTRIDRISFEFFEKQQET